MAKKKDESIGKVVGFGTVIRGFRLFSITNRGEWGG
jgi:hypothetical protein